MPILEGTIRIGAIVLCVLFIVLSLFGIFGAWFVDRKATDVALKVFGVIDTGVGVVNAGVGRVDDLIAKSRTEVRQASETITAAGGQAQANSPVLNALNERLDTSLAPRIAQMQQVLAPVRDAVGSVANFLKEHGWQPGEAVLYRAKPSPEALARFVDGSVEPRHRIADLVAAGLELEPAPQSPEALGVLVPLGAEYRVGLQNFYVITRYNRSALYASAVNDLADALAERAPVAGK